MTIIADKIRQKLEAAFEPSYLEVIDDSDRHAGHAGAQPGGQSHFNVMMVSQAFDGLPRLDRQKKVYAALSEEMEVIHALSLKLYTLQEERERM